MSGPKLSAYELEQLRKAELERVQREIARIKAGILKLESDKRTEIKTCRQEIEALNRQSRLLATSTLNQEERRLTEESICAEVAKLEALCSAWEKVRAKDIKDPTSLAEIQLVDATLRKEFAELREQKRHNAEDRAMYQSLMKNLANNLSDSIQVSTYSFEQAMQNISQKTPKQTQEVSNIDESARSNLLDRIETVMSNPLATKDMRVRLTNAIEMVKVADSDKRIGEIRSLVVDEIAHKLAKFEHHAERLSDAQYLRRALLEMLGRSAMDEQRYFETEGEMLLYIESIELENKKLNEEVYKRAEKTEVEKCIDEAMEELGYELVGNRPQTSDESVRLYHFSTGSAVQMVRKGDGAISMKVVGLSDTSRLPNSDEAEFLYKQQIAFCDAYDLITDKLKEKGIVKIPGTEKRLPPNVQFSQVVNLNDYHLAEGQKITHGETSKEQRLNVNKPKVLNWGSKEC